MLTTEALLIDLDGTLYFKGAPLPGAADALTALRQRGFKLLFLTNTDSQTPAQLAQRLTAMGLAIEAHEIFTCVEAGLAYVRARPGRAYCLLSPVLAAEFEALGRAQEAVRFVVVGDPRHTTHYDDLNTAFRHLAAGAELVALQRGRFFVTAEGVNLDTGAIVALLEYASQKQAVLIGKPAAPFFQAALDRLGVTAAQAMVVGDDVYTDIAGAVGIGMRSVLVRTGKFGYQDLPKGGRHAAGMMPAAQPSLVIDGLADLPKMVRPAGPTLAS